MILNKSVVRRVGIFLLLSILLAVVLPATVVYADPGNERLPPDGSTFALTELTGAYTDVDDDPDSPDGSWLVASSNNVNTAVEASFASPSGSPTIGADLQEFRVLVRQYDEGQTGTPQARIELWENGLLVRAGSDTNIPQGGIVLSFTWNANELGTADGSLVECNAVGTKVGGAPSARNSVEVGAVEWNCEYSAGAVTPTVTTQAVTDIEDVTATGNGNITVTGGENCNRRGIVWDLAIHGDPGNVAPGASGYANDVGTNGSFGTGAFTKSLAGLSAGDTIYCRAYAHNSAGYSYGTEVNFLTKPATPTNVAATDGSDETKVVITWTKSTGATGYQVYRDDSPLGWLGDTAIHDDTGADAPTITAGNTVATDGDSSLHISLSLSGTSANNGTTHTYKVRARNVTGESVDSSTDTGYRGVGALIYQWQRSVADTDADYFSITGATGSTYDDTGAPAPTITPGATSASDGMYTVYVILELSGQSANDGVGRYYKCVLNATGATEQTSSANRGYRGAEALTFQWQRSASDSDADYSNIVGGTTDPYNDADAPEFPAARYFQCIVSSAGASNSPQTSNSDRGYRSEAPAGNPSIDGEDPRDPDLIYLGIRPDLDETTIVDNGAPTVVHFPAGGIFWGYSLPVWNASGNISEELCFQIRVPDRWDGEHDIVVEVVSALSNAGEKGNTYQLDLNWEKVTPEVEVVPAAFHSVSAQRYNLSNLQYYCYRDFFVIDYDAPAVDSMIIEDQLTLRLRLGQVGGQYTDLDGELIIMHVGVLFPRGDLLGEEDNMTEAYFLLCLVILALGLTMVMFITRNVMLGFPCVIFWAVLGGYAYGLSSVTWDWQYLLFFASFGMVIFSAVAMYGLRDKDLSEPDADKEEYFDERGEPDIRANIEKDKEYGKEGRYIDEGPKPSSRVQGLRDRADKRRQK